MGESIKEECLGFFVTKDTFHGLLKYLIPVLAFFMTGACAYAVNEINDRSKMKSNIGILQNKQEFMADTVISKLTQQAVVYATLDRKLDSLLKK